MFCILLALTFDRLLTLLCYAKRVQKSDFEDATKPVLNCTECNQNIINTDFLSEDDIVDLLKDNVGRVLSMI